MSAVEQSALQDALVEGARQRDLVRMHGAIVSVFQSFEVDDALANVVGPAFRRLKVASGDEDRIRLAEAVRGHLIRVLHGDPV